MKANYRQIPGLIANLTPFKGNTMHAYRCPQSGAYIIMSYHTVIATVYKGIVKLNTTHYSVTTSKQQNIIKRCFPKYFEVNHEELNGCYRRF